MVVGNHGDGRAVEGIGFPRQLNAVLHVQPVVVFLVLFAVAVFQDGLGDFGFAGIVGQGGHGQVGEFAFAQAHFVAHEQAQRHDVERVELGPMVLFGAQQVQKRLGALGDGGGGVAGEL